ncbi:MAG: hypothetical protein IT439_02345 [Phycisphaerales bacterium]|nr:hypothetical protein [Phycisphaerales bacterium]
MTRPRALRMCRHAAVGGLLALGGCASDPSRGYALASPYAGDVRTVEVPIFENDSYDTGIEPLLTEALVKEIQRSTPWRVVPGTGDTRLEAAVRDAGYARLSRAPGTGLTQEGLRDLTVDFVWRDNRTGDVLAARRGLRVYGAFVPQRGVGEPADVGQWNVAEELARAIVQELRSTW